MPFVLIFVGALIAVSAYNGTQSKLFTLLQQDLTGKDNFIKWVLAIVILGFLGYIEKIKPLTDAFLVLVIIVMILANKGFFNQFSAALNQATADAEKAPEDSKYIEIKAPEKKAGLFDKIVGVVKTAALDYVTGGAYSTVTGGKGYTQAFG